jgi:hypothetical protein
MLSYTIHDYHMIIDGLDIFYPPYPSQLVVDVYQNVKHIKTSAVSEKGSPDSIPNDHTPGGPLYFIKHYSHNSK